MGKEWIPAAKEKALRYVDADPHEALTTFVKEFREHGLCDEFITFRYLQLHGNPDLTSKEARRFIEGF